MNNIANHSTNLGGSEVTVEVLGEEIQSDLGLVSGHLVASTVHGQEAELGILPFREVTSGLAGDLVLLPDLALGLIAQVPDPALSADGGAHSVIVTRVHQDVETELAVNQVLIVGSHVVVAILLVVADGARARAPLDVGLHVQRLLHGGLVHPGSHVVLLAGLVTLNGLKTNGLLELIRRISKEVIEKPVSLSATSRSGGVLSAHGVVNYNRTEQTHTEW